jgi:hypothetical protein
MNHPTPRCPACGRPTVLFDGDDFVCVDCHIWMTVAPTPDTEDLPSDTVRLFPDDDGPDAAA